MKVSEFVRIYNAMLQLKNVKMIYECPPKKGETIPQKVERRFKGSELSMINRNIQKLKPEFEAIVETEKALKERIEECGDDDSKKEEKKKAEKELRDLFTGEMKDGENKYELPELKKFSAEEFKNYEFSPLITMSNEGAMQEDCTYIDVLYQYLMEDKEKE